MNKLTTFQDSRKTLSHFKDVRPGWTVKVFQRIKEGEKTRVQAFEGMVIARKHGQELGGTVTIRKIFNGIGVEKIYPVYLPSIEKVQVIKKSHVRRAKLYYLKEKSAREIRRKVKQIQNTPSPEAPLAENA